MAHAGFWENIVVTCQFRDGCLQEIGINPIEQGFGRSRGQRGRPALANPKLAASIIDRISKLSAKYGTRVQHRDGKGVVDLASVG